MTEPNKESSIKFESFININNSKVTKKDIFIDNSN